MTPAQELSEFERLLAQLSARFVNLRAAAVDDAITDSLRQIVLLLDVDRTQLVRFEADGDGVHITHSWAVQGVAPVPPKTVTNAYPWMIRQLRRGAACVIPDVADMPREGAVDQASLLRIGARSNLTVPMTVGGAVVGALALGCLRRSREWPAALVERVRALAEVFGNALAHKRAQEALDVAAGFERAMADMLAALLGAGYGATGTAIEAGLGGIAGVLGADHAALWDRAGGAAEFAERHAWHAPQAPRNPEPLGAATTPWIAEQLAAGALVRFGRLDDLPPAAHADLAHLRARAINAAVIVPVVPSGSVVGALSFASARADSGWPAALVPRVRLLGEMLANLLARQAAERREQEAQALAAHAARLSTTGVIAASLVHELTQPLAASLANAQTAVALLEQASPDLGEVRATLADIVADDRRLGELVQQLRRFLRRGESDRAEVDLRSAIEAVLRLVAQETAGRGIALAVGLADDLPRPVGDRVQLEQVLLNLLLNAFDAVAGAAPAARRVELTARRSDLGVRIEVADQGHGMDEAARSRAFQPFFTTKPGGMGLGLAISRTLVAAHGGRISVRSAPGQGTTFTIDLPQHAAGAAVPPEPLPEAAPGERGTVFIVDDDPSLRGALERKLRGAGHRVESFASAQAFLDRLPDRGVACVVSDVRMPGLSGLDLQASLARAGRDLPIVFISAHGDVPTTARAMKAGAVGFLEKPFTSAELLAAVGDALARSRAAAGARAERAALRDRYESLTAREREVFALVAAGLLNKRIADRLGTVEGTIKIHRRRVMEKMTAASVAELVRMAERLGLQPAAVPADG